MASLEVLNAELKQAGAWVFAGGLHPPSTATVVRASDGDVLITDGPFTESKEHLGGFTIVRAPDLDAALEWGRRLAEATTLPIEVRPFQDGLGAERRRPSPQPRSSVSSARSTAGPWPSWSGSSVTSMAEEAVQDAFAAAVERWPSAGLPPSPAGWIITTARNRAVDRLRREASREDRHAQAALLHARDEPTEEARCATTGCG